MKTRIHTFILLGTLAAGPALANDAPDFRSPDAQAQAASLLRAESTSSRPAGDATRGHYSARHSQYTSAQTQAAALLKGIPSATEPAPTRANEDSKRSTAVASTLAGKHVAYQDAQAQAQQLLRGESQQNDSPLSVNVLAVAH